MASIVFTVQTDDGTTVNVSHTVALSDAALTNFLQAAAAGRPLSNNQLILGWVSENMQRAVALVQAYNYAQAVPVPITFSIVA